MPRAIRSGRGRDHKPDHETEKSNEQPAIEKTQHERFIETARELGCDEDEAAFEEKLRRIATVKPRNKGPEKPKQKVR
jgi:hypothetical protein